MWWWHDGELVPGQPRLRLITLVGEDADEVAEQIDSDPRWVELN